MTAGPSTPGTRRRGNGPLAVFVSGAVFLASGAALVVYIVTGAPLALVLGVLAIAGGVAVAVTVWSGDDSRREWVRRVRVGVPTGLVATSAYDLSRWLLVQVAGFEASPFVALPLFGQALLSDAVGGGPQLVAGVAFHLLNGVAFGTAYTVWFGHRPFWFGIGFALGLEALMLAIYPGWLDIRTLAEFTQISVLGHVVYGTVLGLLAPALLRRSQRRS